MSENTFEHWVSVAAGFVSGSDGREWAMLRALEALAAERAEAMRAQVAIVFPPAPPGSIERIRERLARPNVLAEMAAPEPSETAYQRAMGQLRWSDNHPHDGRTIFSMRHWGMV